MDQPSSAPGNGPSAPSAELPPELLAWIKTIQDYEPLEWQRLPELELYMDQVITFINKLFEPLSNDRERLLTSSMINNYVKDGVLPRPEKKKYGRNHLAMLLMICSLKSVLQLPEIDDMLRGLTDGRGIETQYPVFTQLHTVAVREVAERVANADKDATTRYLMALQLALEASVRRNAAIRLLSSLAPPERNDERDKK